ncbi:hypothetical protein EXT51_05970 [Pectobacterium carotovorum subsp. carotovorum]|uniref:primase 1D-like protein n=1 Tax=Pectobacterium carotovorum TaxID=554 RepID=UPI00202D9071|nr:hypothetical protein [Pectobacterium carotovorum]MCL6329053.1 hypothetical protein [Pectobacterium carotovorum subsp. carotovorum]
MSSYNLNLSNRMYRHPFVCVRDILSNLIQNGALSTNVLLTFSKYIYVPQSFIDNRVFFSIPFNQLNEYLLFNWFSELNEGEEIAFHSNIKDFGMEYHLPLIDFGKVDRRITDPLPLKELSFNWGVSFYVYNSGRSFHAYGNRLISNDEWIKFMGSLLLLNKPSGFKLIDERWVGHRIMAGYSALRWTNNSSHYKRIPTYAGFFDCNGMFSGDFYTHKT